MEASDAGGSSGNGYSAGHPLGGSNSEGTICGKNNEKIKIEIQNENEK